MFFLMIAILTAMRWYRIVVLFLSYPNDYQRWPSFHVPVCQLYVLFGETSIQTFSDF